jgi:hypothetical protein
LLLKLGIKEVGMAKNCYKFPNNHIDSLNDRKIIGCRKNFLSIFVALLTFYNKEKKRRKYHILKCQH